MSRKDYQAIAAIVSRHVYDLNDAGIALISELADYLESDNEHFDRERFVDACCPDTRRPLRKQKLSKTHASLALDRPFHPTRLDERD